MNQYFYTLNPWWEGKKLDSGVERKRYTSDILQRIDERYIEFLIGLRRVGKSTITLQLIEKLIEQNVPTNTILRFSIDEPSLINLPIKSIIDEFRSEFDLSTDQKIFVFIDEIQFRKNWELEIKSLYDSENIKFILTGSSAILISEKLSLLTGRYLKTLVNPLDLREYLDFKKIDIDKRNPKRLVKATENYLKRGGMPEYVLSRSERYLETTVESIMFKDLVTKFKMRNPEILLDLMLLLADRVGTSSSSLKLSNILDINKDTVLNYITYLKKVFLISELDNYSTSRNKQIYNAPKIYFNDLGILEVYSSKFNFGAACENAIALKLAEFADQKKKVKLGYWYEDQREIDFILDIDNKKYAFEAKWVDSTNDLNFDNLHSLKKNTKAIEKVFYITRSFDSKKAINGVEIQFISLGEFLLMDLDTLL